MASSGDVRRGRFGDLLDFILQAESAERQIRVSTANGFDFNDHI